MSPDITEYLISLITMGGFVVGLGAVTVIDSVGLFGRTSGYWTKTAIRVHKITRWLIWLGYLAVIFGKILAASYTPQLISAYDFYLIVIIGLNALFLFFYVSPYLIKREKNGLDEELLPQNFQNRVMIFFIISFLSWWSLFLLTIYNLTA